MKKILFSFLFIFLGSLIFLTLGNKIQAQSLYSMNEVELHQTPDDCWMVIEDQIYDLSSYLVDHDRWLNIRDWCGSDATDDYNNKAGMNRDHSVKADEMLAGYLIADLANSEEINLTQSAENDRQANVPTSVLVSRYKVFLPVLLTIALYFLSKKFLSKIKHDFLWNSILLLGLIPVVGFGFILALADQLAFLAKINFTQMLHQHAQLSIIFGTVMVLHFIQRLKAYLSQGKASFRKR
ncbi:MAG: hypothetical protein GX943_02915 [Candidatus Pacebacteria bacterium]|jgi:cytochrome b involved in lipid metabolism|nr:hypothetical protein [Candidatus Paceibacterota bacterium]